MQDIFQNALYDLREKSSEQSMFCIPNLDACVISCHDARSFNEEETVHFDMERGNFFCLKKFFLEN